MPVQSPSTRQLPTKQNRTEKMADEIAAMRQDRLAGARGVILALLLGLVAWLVIGAAVMAVWWR